MPTEQELENYRQQYLAGMRAMSKEQMEKMVLEQAEGMRQGMQKDDYRMRGVAQFNMLPQCEDPSGPCVLRGGSGNSDPLRLRGAARGGDDPPGWFVDGGFRLVMEDPSDLCVLRGGSWDNGPRWLRGAARGWHPPHGRTLDGGFRLVMEDPSDLCVLRGGSWGGGPRRVRGAARGWSHQHYGGLGRGFRLAQD